MPRFELFYLDKKTAEQIENLIRHFASNDAEITADTLVEKIIAKLPIQKTDQTSVRRRVEGLYYSTEILWQEALQFHHDRNEIVRIAALKPLSHYHYLTGSREPAINVMTRADYLNDPATAMVKLKDDIHGLALAFPKLKAAKAN